MGEPLLDRAAKEIAWGSGLGRASAHGPTRPNLSAELRELDALEKRLTERCGAARNCATGGDWRADAELDLVSRG